MSPRDRWSSEVLESLHGVAVVDARTDREGELTLEFVDERFLVIPVGEYEYWHFSNDSGIKVHQAVGEVCW